MKVKELKELLNDCPDDSEVALSIPSVYDDISEGFVICGISGLSDLPDNNDVIIDAEVVINKPFE